jgi:hypothetical protein
MRLSPVVRLFSAFAVFAVTACGDAASEDTPAAGGPADPSTPAAGDASGTGAGTTTGAPATPGDDSDPDAPPATVPERPEMELARAFAPRFHLHPSDPYRPANVDWYLKRAKLRYAHPDPCGDHDVIAKGDVTQEKLVAAKHVENAPNSVTSPCRHDEAKSVVATTSEGFYLEVTDETAWKGAPRAEWKTYVVWRPHTKDANVDIEYWLFYPYNDGFSLFNHVSDWEHVRVTIDPKAKKLLSVRLSAHKGGTIANAGDPNLKVEDGTHPVSYVAKGTHANYLKPGTYEIEGTEGVAKDVAASVPAADVFDSEPSLVMVGTRAKPLDGQVFVKYWGYWGQISNVPETSGVRRHFP